MFNEVIFSMFYCQSLYWWGMLIHEIKNLTNNENWKAVWHLSNVLMLSRRFVSQWKYKIHEILFLVQHNLRIDELDIFNQNHENRYLRRKILSQYIYNIRTLSVNIKFICTSFRNRQNSEPLASFSSLFRSEYKWILYITTKTTKIGTYEEKYFHNIYTIYMYVHCR